MSDPSLEVIIYSAEKRNNRVRSLAKEMLAEMYASRHVVVQVFIRDLKAAYRKSYLGYLWAVIPGLTTTAIWMFLNSQNIIQVAETPIPYPLYVLIGSTLWMFFSSAVTSPLGSFQGGSGVFMKLKVSPFAFILAGLGSLIFDLLLKLVLLAPVFIWFGIAPPIQAIFLFPLGILGILMLGLAIGILLIPLGSLYGDVSRFVGFSLGFLMYLTPVVYPVPKEGWASTLVHLNPATYLLGATRDWLSAGESLYTPQFIIILLLSILLTLLGLVILKIVMPHLVARMGM
jgi:lipopolysaccharide transport system permease protein